jgi:hypothetical protein
MPSTMFCILINTGAHPCSTDCKEEITEKVKQHSLLNYLCSVPQMPWQSHATLKFPPLLHAKPQRTTRGRMKED